MAKGMNEMLRSLKAEKELEGRRERRKKRLKELGVTEEEFASMVDARWGEAAEARKAEEEVLAEVAAADAVNLLPENVEDLDGADTAEFPKVNPPAAEEKPAPEEMPKKPRSRRKPGKG